MDSITSPNQSEPPRTRRERLTVTLAALAAGIVNLFAGGAILKAWVFNAGQTYYDSLFRAFWLPEGIITLPDATITSAGYNVLRSSTELWVLAIIWGIPAIALVSATAFGIEWLLKRTLGRFSPKAYRLIRISGEWFARGYIVFVIVMILPWIIGMIWLGIYEYPNAARRAGAERYNWIVAKMSNRCQTCPRWSRDISGVAIVSNGITALIATPTGVRSIRVEALDQQVDRRRR